MSETVGKRDLRALMAVIEDGRHGDPTEGLPWAVLDGLARLIRCDLVSFPEFDLVHGRTVLEQLVRDGEPGIIRGDGESPMFDEFWPYVREFMPYMYPELSGDIVSVVRWSDFYTSAQLRNHPLVAEFFGGQHGITHAMHLSLPALPGHQRKISFWRTGGRDFTERDRLVVELLRPHLWELHFDSQRRRQSVPNLSAREWEVLRLAHQGNTNREIAQALVISIATVRKHLEHVFDRTGMRTRTAAAALMMPHYRHARRDRTPSKVSAVLSLPT